MHITGRRTAKRVQACRAVQVKGLLAAGTITDPDSLILIPNGDLLLTGEAAKLLDRE